MTRLLALLCLAHGGLAAQTIERPPAVSQDGTELIARFARLDRPRRDLVLRGVEKRLLRSGNEVVQRIAGMERGATAYALPPTPAFFAPEAPAAGASARQLVGPDSAKHREATRGMAPFVFLPDLATAIVYDWGVGKAVRKAESPTDEQRFANYVDGYAPGADHAVARVLEALDTDPAERRLGDYFEHLYADRDGRVFAGTTLYQAWASATQIEMPDTDAIAFTRRILNDTSFVAPLPADRRREQLYERIRKAFATHRDYRTLRLSAAAAFVAADPKIDPTYAPLVQRCHWLWQQVDYEPVRLAERLAKATSRAEWLAAVDTAIRGTPDTIEATRQTLFDAALLLRGLLDSELTKAEQ